jgi:hypothetical protein
MNMKKPNNQHEMSEKQAHLKRAQELFSERAGRPVTEEEADEWLTALAKYFILLAKAVDGNEELRREIFGQVDELGLNGSDPVIQCLFVSAPGGDE